MATMYVTCSITWVYFKMADEEQTDFPLINLNKLDVVVQHVLARCEIESRQTIMEKLHVAQNHSKDYLLEQWGEKRSCQG